MKLLTYGLCVVSMCAVILGCAPKWMPEEGKKTIPLAQVLPTITKKYQGVRSLQAQASLKLEVQGEYYVLQGPFLYENPDSFRMQLAVSFGTVGEIIYTDGLLMILVPSKGTLYQGKVQEIKSLFLTMSFQDYQSTDQGRFPTSVYGELEAIGLRFELTLKEPKINAPVPTGAFAPAQTAWKVYPLADIKELFASTGENRP
jgi:outer membrane lipoprotein-sorting protein